MSHVSKLDDLIARFAALFTVGERWESFDGDGVEMGEDFVNCLLNV